MGAMSWLSDGNYNAFYGRTTSLSGYSVRRTSTSISARVDYQPYVRRRFPRFRIPLQLDSDAMAKGIRMINWGSIGDGAFQHAGRGIPAVNITGYPTDAVAKDCRAAARLMCSLKFAAAAQLHEDVRQSQHEVRNGRSAYLDNRGVKDSLAVSFTVPQARPFTTSAAPRFASGWPISDGHVLIGNDHPTCENRPTLAHITLSI